MSGQSGSSLTISDRLVWYMKYAENLEATIQAKNAKIQELIIERDAEIERLLDEIDALRGAQQ